MCSKWSQLRSGDQGLYQLNQTRRKWRSDHGGFGDRKMDPFEVFFQLRDESLRRERPGGFVREVRQHRRCETSFRCDGESQRRLLERPARRFRGEWIRRGIFRLLREDDRGSERLQAGFADFRCCREGLRESGEPRSWRDDRRKNSEDRGIETSAFAIMYARCGSMADASRVFARVPRLDVVSWNVLLLGYAENGDEAIALEIFATIFMRSCDPTSPSFVAALTACINLAPKEDARFVDGKLVKIDSLDKTMALHSEASKAGLADESFVASMLMAAYSRSGSLFDSWRVFNSMPVYDLVATTTLMQGCVDNGEPYLALWIYAVVHNDPDLRHLELGRRDTGTLVVALQACGDIAALHAGKQIHADACRCGVEETPSLRASLVELYGKCGSMIDAEVVFDSAPATDSSAWAAIVAGYSRQGGSKRVFESFGAMIDEGFRVNAGILCSIIAACSGCGLVDEGRKIFDAAESEYGARRDLEVYHAMIDMLGRASLFGEAIDLVEAMPFQPTSQTWTTLLGACSKWSNVELARVAFDKFVQLGYTGGSSSGYVLMANIYKDDARR